MNVRIAFVCSVLTCSIFANQQFSHAQIHERETQKEQLLPQNHSETLLQRINYIAIQTSPLWVPFLFSYFIDVARASACEAIASQINPDLKVQCAGMEFKTQNLARVGLELSSHALVMSVLQGKIDGTGSYRLDMNSEIVKQSIYNTFLFVVPRYAIPQSCAHWQIAQHEGKLKWIWRSLTFAPATFRVVQAVERAKKEAHAQSHSS